jgi:paraquat-inducible protein B
MNFYVTSNLSYTALDTQGIDWNFSFSLVEEDRPEYIPISDSLLINREREGSTNQQQADQERAKLESQLQEELAKLQKYKKKILGTDINGKELS